MSKREPVKVMGFMQMSINVYRNHLDIARTSVLRETRTRETEYLSRALLSVTWAR